MNPVKLSDSTLEYFNKQLSDLFGVDTVTGQQMWRICWSDDQYEKRLTEYNDKGELLQQPEVRLLPKYKQWIQQKYILEHLVAVPDISADELPSVKVSYEQIYTFQDGKEEYLPPNILVAKFIINTVLSAQQRARDGLSPLVKFIDEEFSQEASEELKKRRIEEMMLYMSGEDASFHNTPHVGYTGKELEN